MTTRYRSWSGRLPERHLSEGVVATRAMSRVGTPSGGPYGPAYRQVKHIVRGSIQEVERYTVRSDVKRYLIRGSSRLRNTHLTSAQRLNSSEMASNLSIRAIHDYSALSYQARQVPRLSAYLGVSFSISI